MENHDQKVSQLEEKLNSLIPIPPPDKIRKVMRTSTPTSKKDQNESEENDLETEWDKGRSPMKPQSYKTLKRQLYESRKEAEKLRKENELLKQKPSTSALNKPQSTKPSTYSPHTTRIPKTKPKEKQDTIELEDWGKIDAETFKHVPQTYQKGFFEPGNYRIILEQFHPNSLSWKTRKEGPGLTRIKICTLKNCQYYEGRSAHSYVKHLKSNHPKANIQSTTNAIWVEMTDEQLSERKAAWQLQKKEMRQNRKTEKMKKTCRKLDSQLDGNSSSELEATNEKEIDSESDSTSYLAPIPRTTSTTSQRASIRKSPSNEIPSYAEFLTLPKAMTPLVPHYEVIANKTSEEESEESEEELEPPTKYCSQTPKGTPMKNQRQSATLNYATAELNSLEESEEEEPDDNSQEEELRSVDDLKPHGHNKEWWSLNIPSTDATSEDDLDD